MLLGDGRAPGLARVDDERHVAAKIVVAGDGAHAHGPGRGVGDHAREYDAISVGIGAADEAVEIDLVAQGGVDGQGWGLPVLSLDATGAKCLDKAVADFARFVGARGGAQFLARLDRGAPDIALAIEDGLSAPIPRVHGRGRGVVLLRLLRGRHDALPLNVSSIHSTARARRGHRAKHEHARAVVEDRVVRVRDVRGPKSRGESAGRLDPASTHRHRHP